MKELKMVVRSAKSPSSKSVKAAVKKKAPDQDAKAALAALKQAIKARSVALKVISTAISKSKPAKASAKNVLFGAGPVVPELDNPPRPDVKPKVIHAIAQAAVQNEAPHGNVLKLVSGDETLDLETDLNLDGDMRERLSGPYTKISVGDYHGKGVGLKESKKAEKVGAAIDIVHKRSNGK